jgi:hypothetical protein
VSADASIEFEWGDGQHKFKLALGQLRELQEKINQPRIMIGAEPVGPYSLLDLARRKDLWPHEVREVIRLGLIGGGAKPLDALTLVARYVDNRPLLENMQPVVLILTAALVGVPDDVVGKKVIAGETGTKPKTGSSSPQSTEPEKQLDLAPEKLTNAHSGNLQQSLTDGVEPTVVKTSRKRQAQTVSTR